MEEKASQEDLSDVIQGGALARVANRRYEEGLLAEGLARDKKSVLAVIPPYWNLYVTSCKLRWRGKR